MKKYTVFHSVTAAPAAAKWKVNKSGSLLKLGLDMHREKFVVVAQYDHATLRPPQTFCSRGICSLGRCAAAGRL